MNKVLEMLLLQQKLNDATNGENWEQGITKNGKIIDWRRCTYLECAELIESYPWKHWKDINAKPDYENIKIEVVDIWHFIMSQILTEYKLQNIGSIKELAKAITEVENFSTFDAEPIAIETNSNDQIKIVEVLIKTLFVEGNSNDLVHAFINIATQSGLNLDSLYKLYIGKNILNTFRQNHGYKDGSYIKIWNGKEDNIVMQNILEEYTNISPDELYEKLKENYHQR